MYIDTCRMCNGEKCEACNHTGKATYEGERVEKALPETVTTVDIISEYPSLPTNEIQRYEVTIQHKIIVYDITEDEARRRAPLLYQALLPNPAARPLEVVAITKLLPLLQEEQSPVVDVAPVLQRK